MGLHHHCFLNQTNTYTHMHTPSQGHFSDITVFTQSEYICMYIFCVFSVISFQCIFSETATKHPLLIVSLIIINNTG